MAGKRIAREKETIAKMIALYEKKLSAGGKG